MNTLYFVWCDHDKKYPQEKKIKDAIQAFHYKSGAEAECVHIHESDTNTPSPVPKTVSPFVRRNYYYIPYPEGWSQH